ncbi:hypothetical protein J4455_01385 [Candidatus Woesearchaeota archaeon]|nr:hypothetical protein [Candidatus Woesearchaeota archaeon]
MNKIVQTPLELALELSLESIGFPLSQRKYFFELAMEEFLFDREFENSTVKDKGRKFYEDLKQEFELLDSRLCDLLHRETIFCKEFSPALFERYSTPTNNGTKIEYSIFLDDEDKKKFSNLKYDEYLEWANMMVGERKYHSEFVAIQKIRLDLLSSPIYDIDISLTIEKDIVYFDRTSGKSTLDQYFTQLHKKRLDVGKLVKGICQVMKEN